MRDGWKRVALGEVTQESSIRVGGLANEAVVLSSTKHRGLVRSDEYFKNRQIHSDDISGYKLVRRGWFAYATNHLAEGSIGLQGIVDVACVSPIYTVFSCSPEIDADFMHRLLKSDAMLIEYGVHDQASVDRRGAVRYRDFKKIEVNLPPLKEQRRIAEILDEVDAQIRRADAEIAKLAKVFRGTLLRTMAALRADPDTKWRPVNEVGDVRLGRQRSPEHSEGEFIRPYLRVANVFDGFIDYSDVLSMNFNPVEQERYELQPGDILLNEGQSIELVGRSALYDGPPGMFFQNTLIRFRSAEVLPEFARLVFKYWLDTGAFADIAKKTTSIAHLGGDRFGAMLFPIPSEGAQHRAVAAVGEVGSASRRISQEVVKLKAMKRALLGDLLTGKVRVPASA